MNNFKIDILICLNSTTAIQEREKKKPLLG